MRLKKGFQARSESSHWKPFSNRRAFSALNVSEIKTGFFAVNTEVVRVHYSPRPITRALLVCSHSVCAVTLPAAYV